MNRPIRIKDIAERAGVSTGTVDRVLHKRGNVSEKARRKVLAVMEELGYERNIIASTLAYNRSFKIAALLPDFQKDIYWELPKKGVKKAQQDLQHYRVEVDFFFFDLSDSKRFLLQAERLLESGPDAILFAPVFSQESQWLLEECEKRNLPNIMINTRIESKNSLAYIGQHSKKSGELAGRLLDFVLHDGQSALLLNLAFGATNAQHLIDKEQGFRQYFAENDQKRINIIQRDFAEFQDHKKLKNFLDDIFLEHPQIRGVFVTNSRTYHLIKCLDKKWLQKVKIVGFDLIPPNLKLLKKGLIHFIINQNPMQQGYLGILNLVNYLILKKEIAPIQYLPLDIVMKENAEYYQQREQSLQLVI